MDKQNFSTIMYGLAENFSAKLTPQGLSLRYEALKGYSIEQIKTAAMIILKNRKYTTMPTVADFVEAIEGTPDDRAELQFALVLRAIRYTGRNGSPKFRDPVTQALVNDRFGWSAICNKHEKDLEFFGKDFKAAYKSHTTINTLQIGHEDKKHIEVQP